MHRSMILVAVLAIAVYSTAASDDGWKIENIDCKTFLDELSGNDYGTASKLCETLDESWKLDPEQLCNVDHHEQLKVIVEHVKKGDLVMAKELALSLAITKPEPKFCNVKAVPGIYCDKKEMKCKCSDHTKSEMCLKPSTCEENKGTSKTPTKVLSSESCSADSSDTKDEL